MRPQQYYFRFARHPSGEASSILQQQKLLGRQGVAKRGRWNWVVTTDTMHAVEFQLAGGVAVSLLYSLLACRSIGMSGSAFFQVVKKSS